MAATNVAMKSMKQLSLAETGTILHFLHLLEQRDLAVAIFTEGNAVLSQKGLTMKRGTVVDATLIAAPSSTKNQGKQRDPQMTQIKKGNQWHFGMTSRRRRTPAGRSRAAGRGHERSEAAQMAEVDVDAESGLIHSAECTTAKVADIAILDACMHREETIVFGDRGYHSVNRTIKLFAKQGDLSILTPTKKLASGKLTDISFSKPSFSIT